MRWFLNLYPPYLFTRTTVPYIAPDWKKIVVKLRKSVFTRNYTGTTFGGALYSAADPHFMLMIIQIIGIRDYIVWDQAAEILYKKPGRSTITFTFELADNQIEQLKKEAAEKGTIRPIFEVEGIDEEGEVCIVVKKTIYIRHKKRQVSLRGP